MIERYLRAKHWMVFVLVFGVPFIMQLIFIPLTMFGNDHENAMLMLPVMMIFYMIVFYGWFWAIGSGLHKYIPTELQLNVNRFKIFLLIPVCYFILFTGFVSESFSFGSTGPGIIGLIMPLHFFVIFCMFYCMHYVAKTIRTVELQRKVTFSDFSSEFFLIWFFPIGIWIIQPRINKIFEERESS